MQRILPFLIPFLLLASPGIPASEEVKVGVILPMTGSMAKFGEMEANAFKMACEDINGRGGVDAKRIRLYIEDGGGKPDMARAAAEKLITRDKVPILGGGYSSSCTFAIAGVAERFGVPFVISTGSADEITQKGWRYVYRIGPPVSEYPIGMQDFWEKVVHPVSIAICYENTLFGTSGARDMKEYCDKKGMKVTDYASYEAGAVDFKPMLVRIKAHKPDVVYMISYIMDASLLMRQSKELDFNPALFCGGAAGFTMPEFIDNAKEASELVTSVSLWSSDAGYPGAKEFESSYFKKFGVHPDYHAVEAYANLLVITEALEKAKTLGADDLVASLDTTEIMTPFGRVKFENYDAFSHQNRIPTLVVQVINGKFETVWPEDVASSKPVYPIKPWDERD
jgi:branched-chain amino acid transport system substrate-binding protein